MSDPVSVVIPARNEAETIESVVHNLSAMECVDEVVVVDNGSDDGTAAAASRAGARVVEEAEPGMGYAVRTGIGAARNDWVMKLDADLENFDTSLFARMPAARLPGVGLVKGAWQDPKDNMPMTRLLVMPAIRLMFPGLAHVRAPNSGLYLFNRSLIAHRELVGSYAVDLDVMLRVHAAGAGVVEADIGQIIHDVRNVTHYNAMAETIMAFFLRQQKKRIAEEIVVMAHEAGEVIASCLGTLAARSRAGGPVTVFLAEATGPAANALGEALAPFPTARILPLEQADGFEPVGPARKVCLIAPYPVEVDNRALHVAIGVHDRLNADAPEIIFMCPQVNGDAESTFAVDVVQDTQAGRAIKQRALEALGRLPADSGGAEERELFQSLQSLSAAQKRGLQSGNDFEPE